MRELVRTGSRRAPHRALPDVHRPGRAAPSVVSPRSANDVYVGGGGARRSSDDRHARRADGSPNLELDRKREHPSAEETLAAGARYPGRASSRYVRCARAGVRAARPPPLRVSEHCNPQTSFFCWLRLLFACSSWGNLPRVLVELPVSPYVFVRSRIVRSSGCLSVKKCKLGL
jgi:hypothetical protein